jgi:uncharacterized membrane protein YhaH (DUF805 family)
MISYIAVNWNKYPSYYIKYNRICRREDSILDSFDYIVSVLKYLVGISLYIANAIVLYKIGRKAGVKHSWLAFIPILQFILFFHIINRSAWWVLAFLIPVVGFIAAIYFYWEFYSAFGIDIIWKILAIIFTFPIGTILLLYIAFSDVTYKLGNNKYMNL